MMRSHSCPDDDEPCNGRLAPPRRCRHDASCKARRHQGTNGRIIVFSLSRPNLAGLSCNDLIWCRCRSTPPTRIRRVAGSLVPRDQDVPDHRHTIRTAKTPAVVVDRLSCSTNDAQPRCAR